MTARTPGLSSTTRISATSHWRGAAVAVLVATLTAEDAQDRPKDILRPVAGSHHDRSCLVNRKRDDGGPAARRVHREIVARRPLADLLPELVERYLVDWLLRFGPIHWALLRPVLLRHANGGAQIDDHAPQLSSLRRVLGFPVGGKDAAPQHDQAPLLPQEV
jgi:hypothetical protein